MRRRGKQVEIGAALDALTRRLDRKGGGAYTAARVTTAWSRVAQGMVAAHTTGACLSDGILVVYVDGNAWATHLTAAAEQYRTAVNDELGDELVTGLRFVVSRKVAQEHRLRSDEQETLDPGRGERVPSVALSETELAQVRVSVEEIPDEELRAAVLRATVKDLEWKKGLAEANGPQRPSGSV